jgi:nucleosome binding factor SPN SPT16 subunit
VRIEEGDISSVRFNFSLPSKDSSETLRELQYIKSITVRFPEKSSATDIIKDVTEYKKWLSLRDAESSLKQNLAAPALLRELAGRKIKLTDVFMRPGLDSKRIPGDLEIFSNGLRYSQIGKSDSKIDVTFENVRHLFFQSCKHEMVVLIHLNLVNPILIGKKKIFDIQFFREASDSLVDETSGRRKKLRLGDEDEVMAEVEERKRRKEADAEFRSFAVKISEVSKVLLVEEPFRELGFSGVPHRQTVLLQPTAESLVYLSEPPFLVVTLAEVEIVYFERIVFGLRNFDMVFVNKDHSVAPIHITSIPFASLEPIKKWLK